MNIKDYKRNFAPLDIPKELVQLLQFDKKDGFFCVGFELDEDDKSGFGTYSDKPQFLDCLYPIGQADGTGSIYSIWREAGSLSDAPIVIFGSEGGVHVVAENLAGFFRILSLDAEPMVGIESVTYYKSKNMEPSEGAAAYADWLKKELKLKPVSDDEEVAKIVDKAQKKHGGKFKTWMSRFVPE